MTTSQKPIPVLKSKKDTTPSIWKPPASRPSIGSGVTYDENIGSIYKDTKMYCFPMSMRHLKETALIPTGITYDNWVYYKVDLIGGINTPEVRDYCHVETDYLDWSPTNVLYNTGDCVTYMGFDYLCLANLYGLYNKIPPLYPQYWQLLTGGTAQVYMSGGTMLVQNQDPDTWDLVTTGYTIIRLGDVHRDGLIWREDMIGEPVYYSISTPAVNTEHVINKHSFYVYRHQKCDKYSKWQLFWLNPHGGYDNFTFDRKMDINYKIERTTYKQRIPKGGQTSFDSYFGGENIFNIDSTEEITLRTNLLTQKESQLMIQLVNSPKVFVLKEYQYDDSDPTNLYKYGVPVIITSNEIKYENKANDKEVFYEIKIKSANKKIIQNF